MINSNPAYSWGRTSSQKNQQPLESARKTTNRSIARALVHSLDRWLVRWPDRSPDRLPGRSSMIESERCRSCTSASLVVILLCYLPSNPLQNCSPFCKLCRSTPIDPDIVDRCIARSLDRSFAGLLDGQFAQSLDRRITRYLRLFLVLFVFVITS